MGEIASETEIRLSVRELVEFILRSGDIDNRRGISPEKAMQEGSRLHRMIQRSMGPGYTPEVPLRYCYRTERYSIVLDGRADGIIDESLAGPDEHSIGGSQISLNQYLLGEEFPQITIDEIKCIHRRLDRLSGPVPVHLAQAKVYAYIYSEQNELPFIRVRMTYCNLETEELRYFFEEYSREDLQAWFEDLMGQYRKWADLSLDWKQLRQESLKELEFPFPFRKGQQALAAQVYKTIGDRQKLFLEAPTGVGKTITTLFPALKAMGEERLEKIFYLTARTITRTVASDTLELLRSRGMRLKSVVITAKEKICPLEKAECNPEACPYAKGHFDRINDAIYHGITENDRLDREIIALTALQYQVCPFELSLDLSLFADTIICDYNYVFDPHASLKRYFADGVKGEYAFLIDEAHNLVERGRNMYSAELFKDDFLAVKKLWKQAAEKIALTGSGRGKKKIKGSRLLDRMVRGADACNRELLRLRKECAPCRVLEGIDTLAGHAESLNSTLTQFLDEEENTGVREETLEFYFKLGHFLLIYERLDEHYRIYAEEREKLGFVVKLLCVDPSRCLSECMEKGRSSILFSATLLPIRYYRQLLGAKDEDIAVYAESAFNKDKLGVFVCHDVSSRYRQRNEDTYYRIARYIAEVTAAKSGNYMVFFPSFLFMEKVHECFERHFLPGISGECLRQKEKMSEEEREAFLARFEKRYPQPVDSVDNAGGGAELIGFCVLGGIFSEGIDLKEDALIGSIVIGVGFPQICNEREIIKEYFEEQGFDYAYRYPGMNKVLQAAGRVIRTERDRGVVVLLDERFLDRSYQKMFPREWSGYRVMTFGRIGEALESFWEDEGES
ncbi:MAG: ATP-dependent DNA helicase [Lachnospiraceae bacterium]|nr:ATP-dependent DNA helicase [Lachnospiraceae bacterium]